MQARRRAERCHTDSELLTQFHEHGNIKMENEDTTIKLQNFIDIKKGEYITRDKENEGIYPVILGGKEPAYYIDRYNHDGKAIVVSRSGASAGYVSLWNEKIFVTDGFLIEPKNNVSYDYIYYFLKSREGVLKLLQGGAAIPHVTPRLLNNLQINLPPLPTQQKIASILSAYDNLIQNYKKQIEALQTAASELYKEWFVRFRFPGYKDIRMKDSSIGKIPETFEVKKQNEVIKDYIGGGWGEDEQSEQFSIEAAVVRGADFPEFTNGDITTCPVRYHKVSNYNSRIIEPENIVLEVSGGTQEQPVGRTVIVSEERLKRFNNKLICASFCKLIKLNKSIISPLFYYYWMQFVYDTRIIDRYQLQSTGIINFKFEYFLRKGDVLLPPKDLMNSFEEKVKVIHSKIEKLAIGITNLTQQRDLLLPRLMSGKLEVE